MDTRIGPGNDLHAMVLDAATRIRDRGTVDQDVARDFAATMRRAANAALTRRPAGTPDVPYRDGPPIVRARAPRLSPELALLRGDPTYGFAPGTPHPVPLPLDHFGPPEPARLVGFNSTGTQPITADEQAVMDAEDRLLRMSLDPHNERDMKHVINPATGGVYTDASMAAALERARIRAADESVDPVAPSADPEFVEALDDHVAANPGTTVEDVLEDAAAAMTAGKTPAEAGLPESVFPAEYVELKALEAELDGPLRAELDDASGWVWLPDWIDSEDKPDLRRAAEAQIDLNEGRQRELRDSLGIEGDPGVGNSGEMTIGGSAAAMVDTGAAPAWGAQWFAAELQQRGGNNWSDKNKARDVGFEQMAPVIVTGPRTAAAFYNQLGAEDSSRIVLTYEDGMRDTYVLLGNGLGMAADLPSNDGGLSFDGAEYAVGTGKPTAVSPLQLLAVSDEIPDDFLIEATAESLLLSENIQGNSYNVMGAGGPYDDVPDDVSFYRQDGDTQDLALGEYSGQTEPGRFGRGTDDPSFVMFALVGERGPRATVGLMNELGLENADALLRRSSLRPGTPPPGWQDRAGAHITEILYNATDPGYTGDVQLSDEAALWILRGAGANNAPLPPMTGDAVERIFVDRPTAMAQSDNADVIFSGDRPDNIAPPIRGNIDSQLDAETVDNALEAVFRGGEGDDLLALKAKAIPSVIEAVLNQGGDPTLIYQGSWLGEVDGRIDKAMLAADVEEARSLDAQNKRIQSVAGAVAEASIGRAMPGLGGVADDGIGITADLFVGAAVDDADARGLWPTDHELKAWREAYAEENEEKLLIAYQVLITLEANDRVELPPGFGVADVVERPAELRNIQVLDESGEPLLIGGRPVTALDYAEKFSEFEFANAVAEAD